MKLEIFTNNRTTMPGKSTWYSVITAFLLLLSYGQASAQCPLGCNNNVQISLDGDCAVEVTPDMVLEGQGGPTCDYMVVILGSNGQPISTSPMVTGAYIGMTLKAEVRLTTGSGINRCWGTITIEDKLPPVVNCPDDITIDCYQSSEFSPPTALDNCSGTITSVEISDEIVDLDCSEDFSAVRTYVYQATDDSGNKSALCVRNVYFERISIDSIDFPLNRDGTVDGLPSLTCGLTRLANGDLVAPAWDADKDGYPDANEAESGTPTTKDGFSIFPNNSYCELNVTFDDQVLTICESSFKVLRLWTVLDWCTGEIREEYQIIKVIDDKGPIITCTPDILEEGGGINADPYTCTADWNTIPPTIIFDCSSTTYEVSYALGDGSTTPPANVIYIKDNVVGPDANGDYVIEDLPLGRTWVRYKVTDGCGNVTYCFTEVDVVDNVPPVPVCDEFTVATLSTNGHARIFAETFDDGSHDNCTDVGFEVRRMESGCGQNSNTWAPYVDFCCADIPTSGPATVMVALRVWDDANGSGIFGDIITKFIDTNESGILGDNVGGVADQQIQCTDNSNICMVTVTVQDKMDPVITCPPNITIECGDDLFDFDILGEATATDNCGPQTVDYTDSGTLSDCGTGTINRTWRTLVRGTSPQRFVTCTQRIRVENNQNVYNGPSNSQWPANRNLTEACMEADTEPSSTGFPVLSGDECAQIATTYEDQVFNFVDDACFKILRHWTVIDWCQFSQTNNGTTGIWHHTQVIKVNNSTPPVIAGCVNRNVDAFGANCDEFVDLVLIATDDCTPDEDLVFYFELDLGNDGSINATGNSNDASRTLAVGTHKITWTVEDMCGNQSTCMQTIRVVDEKKPTPYCLSEITTVVMPSTGEIEIWASDFDLGSTDNCPGLLRFSFSSNVNDTNKKFFCDDIGPQVLDIYVTDVSGNQDFCTTQINIQVNPPLPGEPDGPCAGSSRIAGDVHAQNNAAVQEVVVTLENMQSHETVEYSTPTNGTYQFMNPTAGADFEVTAKKDGDYRNGVNTLDIVKIQRHILGLESLDTPYKLIAADATNDGSVKPSDLLAIRKLILGVTHDLPNKSWRFVDAAYQFADAQDPFPYDQAEAIHINQFNADDMGNNFMAVKIGDVDMSAETHNLANDGEIATRGANKVTLDAADAQYSAGDIVSIPVRAGADTEIVGLQFTLETAGLTFESMESGAMNMTDDNIGIVNSESMVISWNDVTGVAYDNEDVLFVLNFRAKTNGSVANAIALTSTTTNAEAYTSSLETVDVEMKVRSSNIDAEVSFELMQNTPNPFSDQTVVTFALPNAGNATLRVFDITGKVLSQYGGSFARGVNQITVDGAEIQTSGVMYYQLEFEGQIATKKMISIAR